MGLLSLAAAATARCVNIPALQSVGSGDLIWRVRFKVDGLKLGFPTFGYPLAQVDDSTDANRKTAIGFTAGSSSAFSLGMNIPGGGNVATPSYAPGSYAALANGRYIVALFWMRHSVFDHGYAIYDDTATGTLVDGLASGSSVFYSVAAYNGVFPVIAGNGQVEVNGGYQGGGLAQIIDSIYLLNALPTTDAIPTLGQIIAGWRFDDAPGSSTFVSCVSGGPVLTPSGTYTLIGGGTDSSTTYTPTTVTYQPTFGSPTCVNGGTVQLHPETEDQFGATGTLTPATRTYSYTVTSGGAFGSVNSSGLVSGSGVGTVVVTVADTATGGGSATPWVVSVPVTASGAGTTYDVVSSAPSKATTTTGVTGAAGALVTDVAAGAATLTVTRHGTSLSCTVAVTCAGPGTGNEPSGMTPVINTGDMTVPPAITDGGTWTQGSVIPSVFNNYTATGQTASGIDPSYIALAPDGPGVEVKYTPQLNGGYNPVVWGVSLNQPGGTVAGVLFGKGQVRTRNWHNTSVLRSSGAPGPLITGLKLMEPRCGQSTENHVFSFEAIDDTTGYVIANLQGGGVNGFNNYPRLDIGPPYVPLITQEPNGSLNIGASLWREFQFIYGQETTPGTTQDAYIKIWTGPIGAVVLAYDSTIAGTWTPVPGFDMLQATSSKGWQFLMFNQTYGGLLSQYGPPSTMYLGLNQLYFSQK